MAASTTTTTTSLAFLPLSTSKKFPFKLHELLSFAEKRGLEDVVCWLPGGKGFVIHDHQQFCDKVLKATFRHCNYKSFEKQLNNWNFRRDLNESSGKAYSHPHFLRGRKSLCQNMTSKTTRSKKAETTRTGTCTSRIVDTTNGTVTNVVSTPGADDRAKALVEAFAKAGTKARGSPRASAAQTPQHPSNVPSTNITETCGSNIRLLDLQRRLAGVAATSPNAASALLNALHQHLAAKSAMTAATAATTLATTTQESALAISSSEDPAVALAKATVQRFAALERLQLQQRFQHQQRALLLEQKKLEIQREKEYQANMDLLIAAHLNRQHQRLPEVSLSPSSAAMLSEPSAALLEKLLIDRKEQEERAAALLALRLPR
jgi:hypothetical protein